MQLKYNKTIRNQIITVELETCNFTSKENMLIEQYGEPIVKFEKNYEGRFPVEFERRLKNGFKVRVKFNGAQDIELAGKAATDFFEDIQEVLRETLLELADKDIENPLEAEKGIVTIQ